METVYYSRGGVIRHMLLIGFAILLATGLLWFRGAPRSLWQQLGPVAASVIFSLAGYALAIAAIRMILLLGNGGIAFAASDKGVSAHGFWGKRDARWDEVGAVELQRVSNRNSHCYVVSVRFGRGLWARRIRVRASELKGNLDELGQWADRAEAMRVAQGGEPRSLSGVPLFAWFQRRQQARIARDRDRARAASRG